MRTIKLHYETPFLNECEAIVIEKNDKGIVTDCTVAFAEGGGQIGDAGVIISNGIEIPFYDTQKGVGRVLNLKDFPSVNVETPVYHCIEKGKMNLLNVGDRVNIHIDVQRRINTTLHHSALHIALMAANKICPEKVGYIKGCKITEEYGRLDFFTHEKFSVDEIECINMEAEKIVRDSLPIYTYQHPEEKEAWYWKCEDFVCPCGGTHITNTSEIGKMSVKRKNVGKSTERMIVEVQDSPLDASRYYKG